ncbi:hypothetical protein C8R48DRAFT_669681 [Suillus tomentosus]|nr:hypothetical protein C8R48DRAFT_669681 [Suillus tomentosus]
MEWWPSVQIDDINMINARALMVKTHQMIGNSEIKFLIDVLVKEKYLSKLGAVLWGQMSISNRTKVRNNNMHLCGAFQYPSALLRYYVETLDVHNIVATMLPVGIWWRCIDCQSRDTGDRGLFCHIPNNLAYFILIALAHYDQIKNVMLHVDNICNNSQAFIKQTETVVFLTASNIQLPF